MSGSFRPVRRAATASAACHAAGVPEASTVTGELAKRRRVEALRAEIRTLDLQLADKEERRSDFAGQITSYDTRIAALPARESELASLKRDYETLQKMYTDLLSKREQSKVAANLERRQIGEQFKILDPARLPQKPFSPDRLKIMPAGAGFGLIIGVALGAFLEYRDTSLRSEDEILRSLVLPVLAAIPIMTTAGDRDRRRRVVVASVAGTVFTIAGLALVTLWRLGLLKEMP